MERQEAAYPNYTVAERLGQVDMTPTSYHRLCRGELERLVRESVIPIRDVEAVVKLLIEHPDLGAGRASLTLINAAEAYLSTANVNAIKQELMAAVMEEYKRRKEAEKLLDAKLKADLAAGNKETYEHRKAKAPNEIWAIDYVNLKCLGRLFVLCVVYDEYSQKYMGIGVGNRGDHVLATETLRAAIADAGVKPESMRRDNGSPFETVAFQERLEDIVDYPVPPHSPWWNGSLESCNTSLKAAIRVLGMQLILVNEARYQICKQDRMAALELLEELVAQTKTKLNETVARTKHGLTPEQVYAGEMERAIKAKEAFVASRLAERAERMAERRANPGATKAMTLKAKTKAVIRAALETMDTDALFILDEALHKRFRAFEA